MRCTSLLITRPSIKLWEITEQACVHAALGEFDIWDMRIVDAYRLSVSVVRVLLGHGLACME